MKNKLSTQMLTLMGLLIALIIVLSNILAIDTQFLKLTFAFIPKMIMGMIFGPFWTAVGSVVADLIGNTMFAKAPFFFGFTLNKILEGLIYGYFFYNKKITWKNCILCTVTVTALINLGLTPLWLSMLYNTPLNSWIIWAPRLVKTAAMLPIQTIVMYGVAKVLPMERLTRNIVGFRRTEGW